MHEEVKLVHKVMQKVGSRLQTWGDIHWNRLFDIIFWLLNGGHFLFHWWMD